MAQFTVPRGTRDLLPEELVLWQFIEHTALSVFNTYNFKELRTPIFESTELFTRGIGDNTDIISKEMYTFLDRKGRSLTLRPEGTASIVRAYLEHKLHATETVSKLWYQGPMFRYERPQAGRYRQFYQIGCEVLGANTSFHDTEVITMAQQIFEAIGLKDLEININSVGCKVCRPVIKERLKSFLGENLENLCEDCQKRFEQNPLRILDCKNEKCNAHFVGLPDISDVLCGECREHFHDVQNYLNIMRVNYKINPRLVRGLDYYTKTVFEITSSHLGAQNAVCGGGRYDNLIKELGGPAIPAVGFAFGVDRAVMIMQSQAVQITKPKPFVYFVALGENAGNRAAILVNKLRRKNIPVEIDLSERGFGGKLKAADKLGVPYAYIIGDEELLKKTGQLKEMKTGKQTKIPFDKVIATLEKKYKKVSSK